jgi:hypothetical protein
MRSAQNGVSRAIENQEHLAQWMERHNSLSLSDQLRSLNTEPGFRELPPQTQQRYREELIRLNNMNPQQRSRMLDRNEALEHLTPTQQKQWRVAVQQLSAVPVPRRHVILHAIVDLRELPVEQRQQTLESPAFRGQFSDDERTIIRTILTAEPYYPSHPAP